jgi:hypothetical protein
MDRLEAHRSFFALLSHDETELDAAAIRPGSGDTAPAAGLSPERTGIAGIAPEATKPGAGTARPAGQDL